MQLRDVMTPNVEVIRPQATIKDAAERMRAGDIGVLPVCDDDHVLGIITDRDIAVRAVANGSDPMKTAVRSAMTPNAVCCYEDDDIEKAIQLMEKKQIRRMMVCDHNDRPVGIVSLGDLALRVHDNRISREVLENVSTPGLQA